MLPWTVLHTAKIPGGDETLRLKQRGQEFSIMLGTNELMNSRLSGSEEALATFSIGALGGKAEPRLLVGGLGMGFTLRAALSQLAADGRVDVAELVPEVVDWARGPMAALHQGTLDDARVRILVADVGAVISAANGAYDAILLDVDNGPDGLSRTANDALYDARGLALAKRALSAGGVLSVWSSGRDPGFTKRLKQAGFSVEEKAIRANGKTGARHVIWLARRG